MLASWKKGYDKHSVLKIRDTILLTKVHIIKATVFTMVMYRCENWTIKQQRFDSFELRCWRGFLEVPWTARRTNQSILKENNPEYPWRDWCWNWSSNTLTIWCKKNDSLEKTVMWGKIEGKRRNGGQTLLFHFHQEAL